MENSDVEFICANVSVMAVAFALLAVEIIRINDAARRNRRRRMWVKDILRKRYQEGTFHLLVPQLLSDDGQYRNFLRMSKDSFAFLLTRIEPGLKKLDTRCRRALTATEKLAVTLRFLATGIDYHIVYESTSCCHYRSFV